MITGLPWRKVAVIVAAAFVVKGLVLMQLYDHPLLQPHGELDTAYYVTLGQRIAAEGVLAPIGAFFVSPLYVYFLAAVFAAGGSLLTAQTVQIILGAGAVGLSFATAHHWFGGRAAWVAASLAILTGLFTFNEILILQSALDPFLVSCALYALTRAMAGGGTAVFATAGASLGLLALNRPNALIFAVAAAAVVVARACAPAVSSAISSLTKAGTSAAPRARRLEPHRAMILAASLIAVLAANAARNYAVSGDAVLIASHGGLNLYIGNHERADGTYTPVPGITPSIAGQATDSKRVAEARTGRSLSPGEVSDFFAREAFEWIVGHPADALQLWIRKIGILLNRVDVPLNYSYAFYAREPRSVLRALAVGPWLLLPLGLVGLCWGALRHHRQGYWVWAMFVPIYGVAVVLFFVTDRYRMPLFVPLCATAGAAIVRYSDLLRARQYHKLRGPTVAIAIAALAVFANLGLDNGIGGEQTRMAAWLVERGSFDEARRYVERVSAEHRHPGVLRFRVAQALLDAKRPAEAVPLLVQATAIDGPQPAIRLALGDALLWTGRPAEAVTHLEAAHDSGYKPEMSAPLLVRALVMAGRPADAVTRLRGMPDSVATSVDSALDFGTLALEQRDMRQATRWLQIAVNLAPNRAEAHEKLGLALFLTGDPLAARPHLERACHLDPASASAQLNLAVVFAELGRFAEARGRAQEALRLDPAETRAARLLEALPK
jgi:tetratricopeptide (TPR) repeat protein